VDILVNDLVLGSLKGLVYGSLKPNQQNFVGILWRYMFFLNTISMEKTYKYHYFMFLPPLSLILFFYLFYFYFQSFPSFP
jgi:hypothetical protein